MTICLQRQRKRSMSFNSHPHKEDDPFCLCKCMGITLSTHILTRRMTKKRQLSVWSLIFQLTSSQGGWRFYIYTPIIRQNLSTHILTRRMTIYNWMCNGGLYLSTHILTRRMTGLPQTDGNCIFLSTHILTRRMTLYLYYHHYILLFQLTSSQGGWQQF